jgi:hypothetical protein
MAKSGGNEAKGNRPEQLGTNRNDHPPFLVFYSVTFKEARYENDAQESRSRRRSCRHDAAPAMAQGVGVYVGPFGLGVGVHHYHQHRVCSVDYYGYEHCWWTRGYGY